MCTQHCSYWCPGAKAPGHQYPQCWLRIPYTEPVSYRNITFIGDNIGKWNYTFSKKYSVVEGLWGDWPSPDYKHTISAILWCGILMYRVQCMEGEPQPQRVNLEAQLLGYLQWQLITCPFYQGKANCAPILHRWAVNSYGLEWKRNRQHNPYDLISWKSLICVIANKYFG